MVLIEALPFTHTTSVPTPGRRTPPRPQPAWPSVRSLALLPRCSPAAAAAAAAGSLLGRTADVPFNPLTPSPTSNGQPSIALLCWRPAAQRRSRGPGCSAAGRRCPGRPAPPQLPLRTPRADRAGSKPAAASGPLPTQPFPPPLGAAHSGGLFWIWPGSSPPRKCSGKDGRW